VARGSKAPAGKPPTTPRRILPMRRDGQPWILSTNGLRAGAAGWWATPSRASMVVVARPCRMGRGV